MMGCDGCTRCCRELTFELGGNSEWVKEFSEFLVTTRPGTFAIVSGGIRMTVDCEQLDSDEGRCRIYETRPRICRDFLCRRARATVVEPVTALSFA